METQWNSLPKGFVGNGSPTHGNHIASPNGNTPNGTHSNGTHSNDAHSNDAHGRKPKQKRNKPTLSCKECVEHKTKVSSAVFLVS